MTYTPFDLEKAFAGEEVVLRNGSRAKYASESQAAEAEAALVNYSDLKDGASSFIGN